MFKFSNVNTKEGPGAGLQIVNEAQSWKEEGV